MTLQSANPVSALRTVLASVAPAQTLVATYSNDRVTWILTLSGTAHEKDIDQWEKDHCHSDGTPRMHGNVATWTLREGVVLEVRREYEPSLYSLYKYSLVEPGPGGVGI